jgi:DNA-binding IclR family transcriptional regulator
MSAARNLTLRTLDVLEALAGYAANGASNADLAHAAQTSPADISRITKLLITKGWARKSDDNGRFYPTAQFTRLAFRVLADFERLENRIADQRRSMTHN